MAPTCCIPLALFTFLSRVAVTLGDSTTIQEVDSLLYVTEPINMFRMTRHIQLWAADLQGDVDKLDVLMATTTIKDLSLLMATLNLMDNTTVGATGPARRPINTWPSSSTMDSDTNTHRRHKRNILGDVLNFVCGSQRAR